MRRIGFWFVSVAACALWLSACAKIDDKARDYLSSSADVFAVVNGELMSGELALYLDRTGTLVLRSTSSPSVRQCSGQFRYTATTMADIDLRCNDGTVARFSVVLLTETSGFAYGSSAQGPLSLTFGVVPSRAVGYLRAPQGKQLALLPKKPFLELK